MLNGNGSIIYIDDIVNICNKYKISSISNFIIYCDDISKLNSTNIKFENITLYSNDVQKEIVISQNIYSKFEFLFFVLDSNFLEDISRVNFFNRAKKLMKLRKYINLGMVENFYSPEKIKVYGNNLTINDLSSFKFFETENSIDIIINKPVIELYGNNIKIINKDNFIIKNIGENLNG